MAGITRPAPRGVVARLRPGRPVMAREEMNAAGCHAGLLQPVDNGDEGASRQARPLVDHGNGAIGLAEALGHCRIGDDAAAKGFTARPERHCRGAARCRGDHGGKARADAADADDAGNRDGQALRRGTVAFGIDGVMEVALGGAQHDALRQQRAGCGGEIVAALPAQAVERAAERVGNRTQPAGKSGLGRSFPVEITGGGRGIGDALQERAPFDQAGGQGGVAGKAGGHGQGHGKPRVKLVPELPGIPFAAAVAVKQHRQPNRLPRCWFRRCSARLFAILLDAGGSEPRQAVAVDRTLPGEEFLDGQRVAAAGFLQRQKPAADGGDDFGLAPDHPTAGTRRRKIGHGEGGAIGPDDVVNTRTQLTTHARLHRQLGVLTDQQRPL